MPPTTLLVGRGYVATSVAIAIDNIVAIHVPRVTALGVLVAVCGEKLKGSFSGKF